MVRIKHRYLLLQLLYPSAPPPPHQLPAPLGLLGGAATTTTPLPPTLHSHAPTPDALTPALLARLIRDQTALLFGDHGAGQVATGLKIMYLSTATSTAIVRVGRAQYRLVWAALTMVGRLPAASAGRGEGYQGQRGHHGRGAQMTAEHQQQGKEVVIRVVRVSGTVRKCEEEVVRRGVEVIRRAKREGREMDAVVFPSMGGRRVGKMGRERGGGTVLSDDEVGSEMEMDY